MARKHYYSTRFANEGNTRMLSEIKTNAKKLDTGNVWR